MWLRDWKKIWFFKSIDSWFWCFLVFSVYWVCGKQKIKFEARPKLRDGDGCCWDLLNNFFLRTTTTSNKCKF
jgi:hypothetical protein